MKTWIVTGGAGFIGSNFVRLALAHTQDRIVVVDKLTYAGNLESLKDVQRHPRFIFAQSNIADATAMKQLFREHTPDVLVNFAAETHVDRSIDGPHAFVNTNLVGTFVLLETARKELTDEAQRKNFRFLHISTDEVYGSLGKTGQFTEATPYDPSSPYSATKAGADHLVRSYKTTYDLPTIITNCSNNFGPYQFPEKLMPLMILNASEGKDLPIYGDGGNVRDWLYVEDHCAALLAILAKGRPGEKYNLGGGNERNNVQIVDAICDVLETLAPARSNPALSSKNITSYKQLKKFVADRPGHDRRYAVDSSKTRKEIGWKADHKFEDALRKTVEWYLSHKEWCESVQSGKYRRERLGLGS